jgi:hypothetical protein
VNDELVDHVQSRSDKEDLSNVLPSLAQQLAAVRRVPKQRREERGPILMRIPQPGTNRENRGNGGLYSQPQAVRSTYP